MTPACGPLALRVTVVLSAALFHCSSSTTSPSAPVGDAGLDAYAACYPDNDGINGGDYTFVLTVNDTGFSKMILTTQNDAQVMLTLMNTGTKPHGFAVGCTTTTAPAGCPTKVCFPANSTIAPLAPGASQTITFDTPNPDGIIYPFMSSEPSDSTVPGLNEGQWS